MAAHWISREKAQKTQKKNGLAEAGERGFSGQPRKAIK